MVINGIRVVGKDSWKEREVGKSEVEKSQAMLERTDLSWKEPSEVEKLLLKLESFAEVGKFRRSSKVSPRSESLNDNGKL